MMGEKLSSTARKLLSGSVLRLANLVAAGASSFLLMPFIVHHLGDRLYGFWTLAAAFIGYYGVLDFGITSAVSQYICVAIGRNDQSECRTVFNTAFRIQSLIGGVALLVTAAIAAAAPWFCHNPTDAALFRKVIIILGVNMAIGFPVRTFAGVLEAQLRFDVQSGLGIFGLALRSGLMVWAILKGGGLLALAWMVLFATVPVIILQIWFARREAPWARIDHSPVGSKIAKRLFSYSIYTFLGMIGDMFRFQLGPAVIASFIGLAAVTHYRVASVFTSYYVNSVICAVGMVQPVLSRLHGAQDRNGLEKVFFFATRASLCISIFIGFSLIGWGKPFIARWMGPKYQDAYWPLVALSLAVLLDVGQSPSINMLYATFKHRFYTYLNCAEGLINLVCSLLLVRPLGVLGVALGMLIGAFLIRIVAQPFWVCKVSGLHFGDYMRFMGNTVLRCSCLMGAVIAIVSWGLRPSYPWLVGSAICATATYAAGSWFFVFNQREREQLLSVVTRRSHEQAKLASISAAIQ
ncbi:MAG: oligosaccharide flippase family protein [Acidobacteriia bacterium]|nr:oligosaccharide flippase family protein [Terriglobia bacterium]